MSLKWFLIHNPRAGVGKGAKALPAIEASLKAAGIGYQVMTTTHAGHATELTALALLQGGRRFAAVGGDGTVNEVANGLLGQTKVPLENIILTQIPIGTGNDWRRTHGIPLKMKEIVSMLANPRIVSQDVGVVDWHKDAVAKQRYFVNIAGFGFQAYVGLRANAQKAKGKGGIMGYVVALLSSLRSYKPQMSQFMIDNDRGRKQMIYSGAVGICKYNGGGMKQCPDAVVNDGYLDFTLIGEISKWEVLKNVPKLFSGKFVHHPAVSQYLAKEINMQGSKNLLIEVDGENIGHAPAWFSVLPNALNIAVPQLP